MAPGPCKEHTPRELECTPAISFDLNPGSVLRQEPVPLLLGCWADYIPLWPFLISKASEGSWVCLALAGPTGPCRNSSGHIFPSMPLWVWQGETKSGGGLHQSQQRDEGECICGLNKNHNLYRLYWYFKIRSLCLEPEKVRKNYINRNESVCFFE